MILFDNFHIKKIGNFQIKFTLFIRKPPPSLSPICLKGGGGFLNNNTPNTGGFEVLEVVGCGSIRIEVQCDLNYSKDCQNETFWLLKSEIIRPQRSIFRSKGGVTRNPC